MIAAAEGGAVRSSGDRGCGCGCGCGCGGMRKVPEREGQRLPAFAFFRPGHFAGKCDSWLGPWVSVSLVLYRSVGRSVLSVGRLVGYFVGCFFGLISLLIGQLVCWSVGLLLGRFCR